MAKKKEMNKEREEVKEEELPLRVVEEIPTIEARVGIDDDENKFQLLTKEEALTEMLRILRRLDKAL